MNYPMDVQHVYTRINIAPKRDVIQLETVKLIKADRIDCRYTRKHEILVIPLLSLFICLIIIFCSK